MGPPPVEWLDIGWWCSGLSVLAPLSSIFCLLSFSRRFCHSRFVLFCSTVCLCLISSWVSYCVCHFSLIWFSFLHMIPTADTSCCSLFLFIVLLHISFHADLFIQKNLGLCGPNNVNWIKRVMDPICLYLPKPLWQRTVSCGRFVFCCKFVICCRSTFCSRSAFFLWTFLALRSSWWAFGPWFLLGFLPHGILDMDSQKWASTINFRYSLDSVMLIFILTDFCLIYFFGWKILMWLWSYDYANFATNFGSY